MRIAVASDDQQTLAGHFGRTRGFVVYRAEAGALVREGYRENTFTGHVRSSGARETVADRHGPILQALSDCDVVISHGMGGRIHADLTRAGIGAIVTEELSVERAVQRYLADDLEHQPELSCEHGGPDDD